MRDADELERGTDPLNPDSDYDGEWDSQEAEAGTDPLDPGSRSCTLDADFNDDRQVTSDDLQLIAHRWRQSLGDLLYTPAYDANGDEQIDTRDIAWAAAQWGQSCGD